MTIHDEFRLLCAVATSGDLTDDERKRLKAHLVTCSQCRETAQEYEVVAQAVVPSLISDFPTDVGEIPPEWSEEHAKEELFSRLEAEQTPVGSRARFLNPRRNARAHSVAGIRAGLLAWIHRTAAPLPYAAGLALVVLAGSLGYRLGQKPHLSPVPVGQPLISAENKSPDDFAAMSQQRESLRAQLRDRDGAIANLAEKAAHQSAEIEELQRTNTTQEAAYQTAVEEKTLTATERDELKRKLEHAQSDLAMTQADVESLHQQRAAESARLAELERLVGQLPAQLKDRDATIEQQQQLLARDRDIRDLMGARDLYIVDVSDVGGDGKTKKPFGRVFYTKGKSLIFYAYDLDQQPGLHEASSTFQAWGRRGPDVTQAMNLGIFYVDAANHKRWVLKFDDPKSLAQIDGVFVTVEPKGGSRKPSGKPLLSSYLQVEPNHP